MKGFDTKLIDHLSGFGEAQAELKRYSERLISVMTWTEVMVGAKSERKERRFLNSFRVVGLDEKIAALSVVRRQEHRLKLPDVVIYATAQAENCLPITRNTRDFSATLPNIRVPYEL